MIFEVFRGFSNLAAIFDFPVFPKHATSFVNTASTRRIDPHQPEASNSKSKISKCSMFVYLSKNISSSRPFHRHSISPSTASANSGTHLDFAATPYNIDISKNKITLLNHRRVSRHPNPQTCPKARFAGCTFFECFLENNIFLGNVDFPLENNDFSSEIPIFSKNKKTRDAIPSDFQVVARPDLYSKTQL